MITGPAVSTSSSEYTVGLCGFVEDKVYVGSLLCSSNCGDDEQASDLEPNSGFRVALGCRENLAEVWKFLRSSALDIVSVIVCYLLLYEGMNKDLNGHILGQTSCFLYMSVC